MTAVVLLLFAALCLAYANGANDNFKGVATLFGSGTTNYRGALTWATAATFCGSLTAVFLADKLLTSFSGRGLVSNTLVRDVNYSAAVGLGAGLTVLLATRLGMPVSTTHGLVGALVGAGWAAGSAIDVSKLGTGFFLPLLVSPVVALLATVICHPVFRFSRQRLGVSGETCFCVGALLDRLHYLSAGIVSFARGLNDTPKIAALLLLVPALGGFGSTALVGVLIAAGGILNARRVAETMSRKVTPMNHGQGFTANLVTGVIVIGASRWGLPVSTTHVSCGALFGIGAVTRQAHLAVIGKILAAWVTTLPVAAACGAGCYWIMRLV